MVQKFLIFSIFAIGLCIPTPNINQPSPIPKTSCDSSISISELVKFNSWLRDNISVTNYSKLTPEGTLTELWNWKVKQLSSDTTKKK